MDFDKLQDAFASTVVQALFGERAVALAEITEREEAVLVARNVLAEIDAKLTEELGVELTPSEKVKRKCSNCERLGHTKTTCPDPPKEK